MKMEEVKGLLDKSNQMLQRADGLMAELAKPYVGKPMVPYAVWDKAGVDAEAIGAKILVGLRSLPEGGVSNNIAKPKPFDEGRFNVDPGRKKGPDSALLQAGFGAVTGVVATNMQKEAPRPRSGPEIAIEDNAPGAAPGGELIYSGGRAMTDKQMMSGRVAISGLGAAGAGFRIDDFSRGEVEGIGPESLNKILDFMRSAENKEKLKDWAGMEEDAKKALEEALKTKNPDDAPKLFSKIYLLYATALIKQADETPGLSKEERMAKYAEAEKYLLEAVRLDPANAKAWETLSWAQLKQGKYEEAIASASKALALDPNSAKAYYIRSQALKMLTQMNKQLMLSDLKKCAALESAECAKELKEAEEGMRFAPSLRLEGWLGTLLKVLLGGAAILALWGLFVGLGRLVKKIKARIALARMSPEERRKQELASAFSAERSNGGSQDGASSAHPSAGRFQTDKGPLAGKYDLSHVVSRSGPVELWGGKDRTTGQAVLIKKAFFEGPRDAAAKALFLREAHTLAGLRHPNILAVRECLDLPQGIHLIIESPAGKDARALLAERKRFPLAHVLGTLRPICAALEAAHQSGVAHRNVRPSSFLLSEGGLVRLRDFVLSCELEPAFGNGNGGFAPVLDPSVLALKAYDAPEGGGGPQSDVWGLGVSFYELLSGMAPFPTASPQAKAGRAFAKLSSLVPGLPASIDTLIHRALDPDPRARVGLREFATLVEGACQALSPARH